jgi:hypothetical protein
MAHDINLIIPNGEAAGALPGKLVCGPHAGPIS